MTQVKQLDFTGTTIFSGLALPKGYEAGQYWSRRFIKELQSMDCGTDELKITLGLYIKDFLQTRTLLLEATRAIRKLCKQPEYQPWVVTLRSIPGIGEINAAIILFELQDTVVKQKNQKAILIAVTITYGQRW